MRESPAPRGSHPGEPVGPRGGVAAQDVAHEPVRDRADQLDGGGVGPVQVLDDQHQRAGGEPTLDQGANRHEDLALELLRLQVADARVVQASPTTNFGTSTNLQSDQGTTDSQTAFIRFTISGVSGTIQSVKLRVFCTTNGTANGPAAYLADSNWTESGAGGVTWNTEPSLLSGAADNKDAIAANSWVEYDVTSVVAGDGAYTFALVADSTDGVTFSSRS